MLVKILSVKGPKFSQCFFCVFWSCEHTVSHKQMIIFHSMWKEKISCIVLLSFHAVLAAPFVVFKYICTHIYAFGHTHDMHSFTVFGIFYKYSKKRKFYIKQYIYINFRPFCVITTESHKYSKSTLNYYFLFWSFGYTLCQSGMNPEIWILLVF